MDDEAPIATVMPPSLVATLNSTASTAFIASIATNCVVVNVLGNVLRYHQFVQPMCEQVLGAVTVLVPSLYMCDVSSCVSCTVAKPITGVIADAIDRPCFATAGQATTTKSRPCWYQHRRRYRTVVDHRREH
jgi:uncharacterized protein YggT (Ycf19 family)